MSNYNNINGVWRRTWSSDVNINGVWRSADAYGNVNGIWRETHHDVIQESEIIGFRMVYKRNPYKKHPDFPNLSFNPDLPVTVDITGETIGHMDYNPKTILFQYDRSHPDREGILMYEGNLYAVLVTGELVDIGQSISNFGSENRISINLPSITEVWTTSKINTLNIQINSHIYLDANGLYTAGWNSLFNVEEFITEDAYPNRDSKKFYLQNYYNILPVESRESTFDSVARIGIARDVHSMHTNMVGSYGSFDHTISKISVNSVAKPFVFELYD